MTSKEITRRTVLKGLGAGAATVASGAMAQVAALSALAVQEDGGTLTFATASPWSSYLPFKPVVMYGSETNIPAVLTHSRLVDFGNGLTTNPGVAESWDVSPDATKITFHLRQDVKFSDGVPLTARDVEATVRLYLTKETNIAPEFWIDYLKGGRQFYEGESSELPGLQVQDEYTVAFELERPFAGWLEVATTDMNILPAHIFADINPSELMEEYSATWFDPKTQIGSGPFVFVGAERDEYIELARNEGYYGGTPKLERIIFMNVGTADTQFIALEKGELDVWSVPADYVESVQALENVNVYTTDRLFVRFLVVNTDRPYLADKRIRQALLYGIDRESLCAQLMNGLCTPYNSFMQVESWLAPDLNEYPYDPDMAKQLLQEAGWDPDQVLRLDYYYDDPLHRDWFAAIQQQLLLIGVKTEPHYIESPVAVQNREDCDFDLQFEGLGTGNPASYGPKFRSTEGCTSWWKNDEVDQLFKEAEATADDEARREILYEIQRLVNDEVGYMAMIKLRGVTAVNKRVSGFNDDSVWMVQTPYSTGKTNAENWAVTS